MHAATLLDQVQENKKSGLQSTTHEKSKIKNNELKRILKDITFKYIPKELMDRPKKGFGVPIEHWLKNEFKEELWDYTDTNYLKRQGIFEPIETQNFISFFMNNKDGGQNTGKNYAKFVWSYFVFQQWYSAFFIQNRVAKLNYIS